jgi:hypothetical protein
MRSILGLRAGRCRHGLGPAPPQLSRRALATRIARNAHGLFARTPCGLRRSIQLTARAMVTRIAQRARVPVWGRPASGLPRAARPPSRRAMPGSCCAGPCPPPARHRQVAPPASNARQRSIAAPAGLRAGGCGGMPHLPKARRAARPPESVPDFAAISTGARRRSGHFPRPLPPLGRALVGLRSPGAVPADRRGQSAATRLSGSAAGTQVSRLAWRS